MCNADPAVVFGKLLPAQYCGAEVRKARRMEYSTSALSLFCTVEMDLKGLGYDSGNYWWYRTCDLDGIYRRVEKGGLGSEIDVLFLAITSLKDPGAVPPGHHTLEIFTFVPWEAFEPWAGSAVGERGADYEAFKRTLGERLLEAAEHVIPGLRSHVRFAEVGTPLTNDFYCDSWRGSIYGTAKTPGQLGPFSYDQRGPVNGLHFCGASTLSHGVAGASLSGLMAAADILGVGGLDGCLGPTQSRLRIQPAERAVS